MIRPTFLAFETAKRALNVSQAGLDTVGHNISNVNTAGYTRQRVDQVSIHSSYSSKYQIYGAGGHFSGQGAVISGINQIRDPYLDTRYRNEAAIYGELTIKNSGLTDLENVLDEISTTGLYDKLGDFINEITKYAQSADNAELAVVVRNAASQVTQVLNKNASELQGVLEQQLFDLDVAVKDEINSTIEQISYLNAKIRENNIYGNPANELNDERNLLIDQLSQYLPIKVVHTPEQISENITIQRVSIQLLDSSKISGLTLVDNDVYNQLGVNGPDENGNISISLLEGRTGFALDEDITARISGGGLKGFIDVINGKGDYAGNGENTYRGVQYYIKALDTFAQTFAELMNSANSITASEADDKDGVNEYLDKNLFVSSTGSTITAATISISKEWINEASFLTTTKQSLSDPVPVLDEDGNPTYDLKGDQVFVTPANSDNLLIFKALLADSDKHFVGINGNGEPFTCFRGSFQEALVSIQSTLGLDQKLNTSLLSASDIVISGYADQRDAISAVSVDEEAINMMTYQNYYNAAARYMTVLDEALGTIIQQMGVVGR